MRRTEAQGRLELAQRSSGAVPCAGVLADDIRGACSALVGHFRVRDEAQRQLDDLDAGMAGRQAALDAARAASGVAAAASSEAQRVATAAHDRAEGLRGEYRRLHEQQDGLRRQDRTAPLDRAEAEAGAIRARLEAAVTEASEASAAAYLADSERPRVDMGCLRAAEQAATDAEVSVSAAELDASTASRQVARLEAQVEAARSAQAKAEQLMARVAPLERDLSEWRFLSRGLGREGVQALELDAAGPRVSALANELLADAYGPRFQIRFETQAARADGKGVKETFDVVVVDTERGREGNGEDLSGGEKVIVGEALGLAVGLFHSQASGVDLGTVVRDETVGALDPENGERYLAMLRGFLRVGKVHQLLYVAHQPGLVELADAVVRVENGRIEVAR
jgi:exonuclease SbcC